MKINYKGLVSYIVKSLELKEGKYDIVYVDHDERIDTITIDKDYNVVAELYGYTDLASILSSKYTKLKKVKPPQLRYIYLDENLLFVEKTDVGDKLDKTNKETHNYFPVSEFSINSLIPQLKSHIINMRLNLLANFYPSVD